jgi:hypothetical protein
MVVGMSCWMKDEEGQQKHICAEDWQSLNVSFTMVRVQ